jgi:hypothetical protein
VLPQHGLDRGGIQVSRPERKPLRDPARLGRQLRRIEVLLAAGAVEEDDRDQAAAEDEADEEQPPLELGHQRGSQA